jgi:hypothetical protein
MQHNYDAVAANIDALRKSDDDGSEANPWPVLNKSALFGVAGGIVEAACARSEADPAAVLASVLAWFGASFGSRPHVMVGDTPHFPRFFSFKVGATSKARKGTSEDPPKRIFRAAEALEIHGRRRTPLVVSPGPLSTGEGLVRAVRDPSDEVNDDGQPIDPGVTDKRLLVIEGELGAPLKAAQREGNTLSAIMRMAFDSGDIAPLTKSNRIKATGAHISVIGHITRQELMQLLRTVDIWNGFANRVLWFCVRRPKRVPFPEPMDDGIVETLAREVRAILDRAQEIGRVTWSDTARSRWTILYRDISVEEAGAFGAVTARAEALLQRLSLVYALIDKSNVIELRHFLAAMAVWEYAKASARLIFEGASEDPNQTKVLQLLETGPLTQSQLNIAFGGHLKSCQLTRLLEDLQASGVIQAVKAKTSGRPVTTWSLVPEGAEKAEEANEPVNASAYSAYSAYSAGAEP